MGIWSGAQHLVVAGGVEKMSCTPSVSAPVLFDCENAHLRALNAQTHQGISADLVASIEGFSREDLDSFAWNSQQRAAESIADGAFAGSVEIGRASGRERGGPVGVDIGGRAIMK